MVEEARADARLRRLLDRLRLAAVLVAVLVAISLPAARLYFGAQTLQSELAARVASLGNDLSALASRNPDGWVFERNAIMTRIQAPRTHPVGLAFRVEGEGGKLVAEQGAWVAGRWPEAVADVLDSGVKVAQVRGQATWLDVLPDTLTLGVVGLLLEDELVALIQRQLARRFPGRGDFQLVDLLIKAAFLEQWVRLGQAALALHERADANLGRFQRALEEQDAVQFVARRIGLGGGRFITFGLSPESARVGVDHYTVRGGGAGGLEAQRLGLFGRGR